MAEDPGHGRRASEVGMRLQAARRVQAMEAVLRERQIEGLLARQEWEVARPILAKGWAVARLYPEPGVRQYTDIDLFIRPEHRELAAQAVGGFQPSDPQHAIPVDLQTEWLDLPDRGWAEIEEHARLVPVGQACVTVPGPEDTLRLSCLHLLRHLAFNPIWLCDVGLQVESLPAEFDWDYCSRGSARRTRWMGAVLKLASLLLGASTTACPPGAVASRLPKWFVNAVLRRWGDDRSFMRPQPLPVGIGTILRRDPVAFPRALAELWPDPLAGVWRLSWPINRLTGPPAQVVEYSLRAVTWVPRHLRMARR